MYFTDSLFFITEMGNLHSQLRVEQLPFSGVYVVIIRAGFSTAKKSPINASGRLTAISLPFALMGD